MLKLLKELIFIECLFLAFSYEHLPIAMVYRGFPVYTPSGDSGLRVTGRAAQSFSFLHSILPVRVPFSWEKLMPSTGELATVTFWVRG